MYSKHNHHSQIILWYTIYTLFPNIPNNVFIAFVMLEGHPYWDSGMELEHKFIVINIDLRVTH